MRPCVPKTVSLASCSFSCSELGFVFSGGWAQTLPRSGYCGAGGKKIFFSLWCQPLCWTCCRASCPGKRRAEPGSGPATWLLPGAVPHGLVPENTAHFSHPLHQHCQATEYLQSTHLGTRNSPSLPGSIPKKVLTHCRYWFYFEHVKCPMRRQQATWLPHSYIGAVFLSPWICSLRFGFLSFLSLSNVSSPFLSLEPHFCLLLWKHHQNGNIK